MASNLNAQEGSSAPNIERDEPRLTRSHYKTLGLSTLGGGLEYYEFIIFLYLSPILGHLMFPPEIPPWLRQVQILAIFSVGYIARPIGGMIVGSLSDQKGRKKMFGITLLMIAAPTFFIGILPTYQSIGALAPILLLVFRICQGIAIGGELPAAVTFVVEHVPPRRQGLAIGLLSGALAAGSLLAIGMLILMNSIYDKDSMYAFGWRIPFLLGGIGGIFSAYLRRYLRESPVFEQIKRHDSSVEKKPIRALLKNNWREVSICFASCVSTVGVLTSVALFPLTYLQGEAGIPASIVTQAQMWMLVGLMMGEVSSGWLSDKIGTLLETALYSAFLICVLYITYHDLNQEYLNFKFLAIGVTAGFMTTLYRLSTESFPARVRVTGFSFVYGIASAVVGGFLPVALGYLAHWDRMSLVYIPAIFSIIGIVACLIAPRYKKPLFEHETAA
ncbi:MFS transporter [Burkholderia contaminans]|nr:MFS transporter [Burkholderia contaminans]